MLKTFEMAKNYYKRGLWNKKRIQNLVIAGILNKYEYELITGESFD